MTLTRLIYIALLVVWVGSTSGVAIAQESGLTFLEIGIDAESTALGDANVNSNGGAFAAFWNPAGLAGQRENSISAAHHIWIANDRTYALYSRLGTGETGGIGLFVHANTVGDIEQRDNPGPSEGTFSAQYLATGIGYGRAVGRLRVGASIKYISERVIDVSARGYGIDAGIQLDVVDDLLIAGAALTNAGSLSELESIATTLPTTIRGGLTIFPFRMIMEDNTRLVNTMINTEVSYNEPNGRTRLHVGASAEVVETVTARVGYITNDALRGITAGLGLAISEWQFDYALVNFENGFGGPGHVLSLGYRW